MSIQSSPAGMHLLLVHAHQRLGEMAAGAGWHLVEARLQISGQDLALATSALCLAAPAAVALTFACGLHAPLALRADGHNQLLLLSQMEDVDLLQVERSLSHRAVDLQLIAGNKLLYNGSRKFLVGSKAAHFRLRCCHFAAGRRGGRRQ